MWFKNIISLILLLNCVGCGKAYLNIAKDSSGGNVDKTLPSLLNSHITVSEDNIADGVTPGWVTLHIYNGESKALQGLVFEIAVGGQNNTVIPCTATDHDGVARCKIYSTKAENKNVKVWNKIILSGEIEFSPINSKRSAGIVSSGNIDLQSGKVRAISSSGIIETPAQLYDSAGKLRAHTSLQHSLLGN